MHAALRAQPLLFPAGSARIRFRLSSKLLPLCVSGILRGDVRASHEGGSKSCSPTRWLDSAYRLQPHSEFPSDLQSPIPSPQSPEAPATSPCSPLSPRPPVRLVRRTSAGHSAHARESASLAQVHIRGVNIVYQTSDRGASPPALRTPYSDYQYPYSDYQYPYSDYQYPYCDHPWLRSSGHPRAAAWLRLSLAAQRPYVYA